MWRNIQRDLFFFLQERHADSLIQNQHYQVSTAVTASCRFVFVTFLYLCSCRDVEVKEIVSPELYHHPEAAEEVTGQTKKRSAT